jgi:subtilase family serine protease
MSKNIGYIRMEVKVECPNCEDWFDLMGIDEADYVINAIFTNTTKSCTDLNYVIMCPHCEEDFILNEFEW